MSNIPCKDSYIRSVLVYPLSGYGNRLQAIASAAILAEKLGAELSICWDAQAVAPGKANEVFAQEFCNRYILTSEQAEQRWGCSRANIPLYLNIDRKRRQVTLAGHYRGEQAFMAELPRALADECMPETLVIAAGGQFFLPDPTESFSVGLTRFRCQRKDFYSQLRFTLEVESAVREQLLSRPPYVGLHLRYTDRALQAPMEGSIRRALRNTTQEAGIEDVFIASDTLGTRERWSAIAAKLGLRPWAVDHKEWNRSNVSAGHSALIDWLLLTSARSLVYFRESTFALEACVAGGSFDRSTGLATSVLRGLLLRGRDYAQRAITYPRRHGWGSSAPL